VQSDGQRHGADVKICSMPSWRLYPLLASFLIGCVTAPVPVPPVATASPEVLLTSWSADGQRILAVQRAGLDCRLVEREVAGPGESARDLGFCPESMRVVRNGSLLLTSEGRSYLLTASGERVEGIADALDSDRLLRLSGRDLRWPDGKQSGAPERSRSHRLLPDGSRAVAILRDLDGERLVLLDSGGGVATLAGPFSTIDSFDLAPDGEEAVFSAQRENGFDVALVATAGSEVHWVGPDVLDETMVSWAPRGSKITYRIDAPMGSVLRSVHVPTGFQKSFSWPATVVRSLSWQPAAEEFVVLAESPSTAPHARIADYAGEGWRPMFAAGDSVIAGEPEVSAALPHTWTWAPGDLRYGERVPLVVWLEEGRLWGWNQVRADLQQNLRIGTAVLARGTDQPGWLAALLSELRWADPARVFIVTGGRSPIAPGGVESAVILMRPETDEPGWAAERVELRSEEPELEAARWLTRRLEEVNTNE
jgi:hypothetical protein